MIFYGLQCLRSLVVVLVVGARNFVVSTRTVQLHKQGIVRSDTGENGTQSKVQSTGLYIALFAAVQSGLVEAGNKSMNAAQIYDDDDVFFFPSACDSVRAYVRCALCVGSTTLSRVS